MKISTKRDRIIDKIDELMQQMRNLQNECPPENVTTIAKSDTGNWCSQDDEYWYDITCHDCGKRWTEDQ
jgi:hypothetical protein